MRLGFREGKGGNKEGVVTLSQPALPERCRNYSTSHTPSRDFPLSGGYTSVWAFLPPAGAMRAASRQSGVRAGSKRALMAQTAISHNILLALGNL